MSPVSCSGPWWWLCELQRALALALYMSVNKRAHLSHSFPLIEKTACNEFTCSCETDGWKYSVRPWLFTFRDVEGQPPFSVGNDRNPRYMEVRMFVFRNGRLDIIDIYHAYKNALVFRAKIWITTAYVVYETHNMVNSQYYITHIANFSDFIWSFFQRSGFNKHTAYR